MDQREVRLIPVYLEDEILPGDDLLQKLSTALRHQKTGFAGNDVLVVKHKILSKAEGRVVPLGSVRPRKSAGSWGRRYGVDAREIELELREANRGARRR